MASQGNRALSRRRLLQGMGTLGITTGLAGCSSSNNSGSGTKNNDNTAISGGEPVEQTWTGIIDRPANTGQHNPWGKNYNFDGFWIYDYLGRYHDNRREFVGFIAKDWSIEGKTATITLRDTYTWHNGDPVTAEDLVTQLYIESLMGAPFDAVESWEATDKHTVEFQFTKPVNEFILRFQLLNRRLMAKTEIYGKFAERIRKAGSEKEKKKIASDLQNFELHFRNTEHPIGNGPWKFKKLSTQAWTFELYEDYDNGHFRADERNFNQAEARYVPTQSKRVLALANGKLDYFVKTHLSKAQIEQQPPEVQWNKTALYNGYGIVPNFNKKPWDDIRVRQAILYALDFGLVAKNSLASFQREVIDIPCGISNTVLDEYLDDTKDKYLKYRQNKEKASQLLRDAGFSKDNGQWYKPNGEKFAPLLKEGRSGYWISIGQNVVGQLQSFGIDASLRKVDHTQMYGQIVPNGNFEIIGDWWSGLWYHGGYPGFHIREVVLGWWADQIHYPQKIKVPMPIGNPNGSPETINVEQLFAELSTARNNQRESELIHKIAWLYNMTLPKMPVTVEHDINLFNTTNWNIPDINGKLMKQGNPHWWVDRMGEIQAETK